MEKENFKEGDLVKLKSGGPVMTIASSGMGMAACVWFNKDEIFGKHDFYLKNLVKVEADHSFPLPIG
ncbi:DUF2158 domain-containing protein [Rufibacter roseus]|uniref:DUF2158 domain-containing protein n=1 Tax=Rufibacter roseus TaxID=1567108 RepID=A0ABW2DPA8_9BACT|nr:DUF2158 domain-containing protein [Rufibacter roseus]